MVYGIDECRRCGKSMRPTGPAAWTRLETAKRRRPTMTPEQWKAEGWLAAPTPWQLSHKLDGVCFECAPKIAAKTRLNRPWHIYMAIVAVAVVFLLLALASVLH